MKVILKNSNLVFSSFRLTKIGEITLNGLTSSNTFGGTLEVGEYYLKVVTSSSTPLVMRGQYNAQNYTIKTFASTDFGNNVKVDIEYAFGNFFWIGDGDYTVEVYVANKTFTKLGEVSVASAYTNNKLLCNTSIPTELASILAQHNNVYIKARDSNNLLKMTPRGVNILKYIDNEYTHYNDNAIFNVLKKCINIPDTNIYIQCSQALSYTPVNGDTTIKFEFYSD